MYTAKSFAPFLIAVMAVGGLAACGGDDGTGAPEVGAIEGTVLLEGNGAGEAVSIAIDGSQRATESDEEGKFTFQEIAPGSFTLIAEYPDYVTTTAEIDVTAGETTTVDIEMDQVNVAPSIERVEIDPPVFEPGGEATVTVTATDPNPDTLSYEFEASADYEIVETSENTATIKAPQDFDAEGKLTIVVSDEDGETARQTIDLITVDNRAPVIEGVVALPSRLAPGETSTVTVSASDADGDDLAYQWEVPTGWTIDDETAPEVQITAPDSYGETAVVKVTVTDAYDVPARGQVVLEVLGNEAPSIASITATPPQTILGGDIELSASASDPENDDLTYEWSAPAEWTIADASAAQTTITAPDTYGSTARVTLTVTDPEGASASSEIVVSTAGNDAPIISSINANPQSVLRGGDIQLAVTANDPNGDTLSYQWTAPTGWSLDDATLAQPTLTAPAQSGETASIEVTVTDAEGLTSTGSVVVSTTANNVPTLSSLSASPTQTEPGGTITLAAVASDADGDALNYTWEIPPNWTLSGSGAQVSVTAPDAYSVGGPVKVTVEDGFGGTVTGQTSVSTVRNETPVIQSFTATANPIRRGESTSLRVSATDANGDAITYSFEKADDPTDQWTLTQSTSDPQNATLQAPDTPDAAVTVRVVATDAYGASTRTDLRIATRPNDAPIVTSLVAARNPVAPQGQTALTASASDPNGDTLTYDWAVADSTWTVTPDSSNPSQATLTAPDTYDAATTVTVTVTDDVGATNTSTLLVATTANQAPIVSSLNAAMNPVGRNGSTTVTLNASDPNGDALSYNWTVSGAGWSITPDATNPSQASLQAPDSYGASATVTVEVSDGYGMSTTANLQVSTESNSTPVIASFNAGTNPLVRSGSTTLTVSASDPNGDALTYDFAVPAGSGWMVDASTPTDAHRATLSAPDTAGSSVVVTVTVTDDTGESATADLPISVEANQNPTIASLSASQDPVARAGTTTLTVSADDANSTDTLSYAWTLPAGSAWSINGANTGTSVDLQAPDVPDATVQATVEVSDDAGGTTTAQIQVSTRANREPTIDSTPSTNTVSANGRRTFTYQVQASDADDATLTYTFDGDGSSASFDPATKEVTWSPVRSEIGSYTFQITVTDGYDTDVQQWPMTATSFELDWEPSTNFSTPAYHPATMDVDGDGADDVVSVNGSYARYWLSSDSFSTLYQVELRPTADERFEQCYGADAVDLSGGGDQAIVIGCRYLRNTATSATTQGPMLGVLSVNPSPTGNADLLVVDNTAIQSSSVTNQTVRSTVVADVTGDGVEDALIVSHYSIYNGSYYERHTDVHTFVGDGAGSFTAGSMYAVVGQYSYFRYATVGDFDASGDSELALDINNENLRIVDFDANGAVTGTPSTSVPTLNSYGIVAADLNLDGADELVVLRRGNPDRLDILDNDGAGQLSAGTPYELGHSNCVYNTSNNRPTLTTGDFDADGQMDVAYATYNDYYYSSSCPHEGGIAFNDGAGSFDATYKYDVFENSSGGYYYYSSYNWVAVGDFDGDGIDDPYVFDDRRSFTVGH